MLAQLIPLDGGVPIPVDKDVTLVGRKSRLCDLVVERASVSKLHCLIVKTDGLLFIRDLGSTNGTKVNGQRVSSGALLPGDELAFAGAKFRVHLGPDIPADDDKNDDVIATRPLEEMMDEMRQPQFGGDRDSESDVRMIADESDV